MKKYLIFTVLLVTLFWLASCEHTKIGTEDLPLMVEVELEVTPEIAKPNEMITFQAKVTYGDEVVTDAQRVRFEIWRSMDQKHEKIEVVHAQNGIYQLEKSFAKEGTYYVISHVTARDMHNMPKKQFTVGEPSEPEKRPSTVKKVEDKEHEVKHDIHK